MQMAEPFAAAAARLLCRVEKIVAFQFPFRFLSVVVAGQKHQEHMNMYNSHTYMHTHTPLLLVPRSNKVERKLKKK